MKVRRLLNVWNTVFTLVPVDTNSEVPPVQAKPSVANLASQKFPAFDQQGVVVEPFEDESKRDIEFQESEYMRPCVLLV